MNGALKQNQSKTVPLLAEAAGPLKAQRCLTLSRTCPSQHIVPHIVQVRLRTASQTHNLGLICNQEAQVGRDRQTPSPNPSLRLAQESFPPAALLAITRTYSLLLFPFSQWWSNHMISAGKTVSGQNRQNIQRLSGLSHRLSGLHVWVRGEKSHRRLVGPGMSWTRSLGSTGSYQAGRLNRFCLRIKNSFQF